MKIPEWISRSYDKIYASQVKEYIPRGFRSHVFVMRVTGIWPTADDSAWYKRLTIAFFSFSGILFPLSMFINVVWAKSIQEAMDRLFFSLTLSTVTFKSAVIYWRNENIREIFRIHASLLPKNAQSNKQIVRVNFTVHLVFTAMYFLTWCAFALQSIFTQDENTILPSTSHWPFEFAQRRWVFWTVLVYQLVGCFTNGVCDAPMHDAFYLALLNAICGHVAELKERLRALGSEFVDGEDRDGRFYKDLVNCCKRYEAILRLGWLWCLRRDAIFLYIFFYSRIDSTRK